LLLVILPLVIIFALLIRLTSSRSNDTQWNDKNYDSWLTSLEGHEFFCYTNRKESVDAIEKHITPTVSSSIHVIKLIGKEPITELDKDFVSHALCNLNNVGFPNLMKVVDGKLHDITIRKPIYDAINQGKTEKLPLIFLEALHILRRKT